jgi:hypothetical protein
VTGLAERWSRFWFPEDASLVRLGAFRIGVMGLCLMDVIAYGSTALRNAAAVSAGTIERPWRPIYLFEVLGFEPIGHDTAQLVYVLALGACALGMLGVASRVTCAIAGVLVLYWTGLAYSFGKVHHEKVALAFTVLALPLAPVGARLSIDALLRRLRGAPLSAPTTSPLAALPLRLCMVSIAIGYSASGLTKLAIAGPGWANGYSLMAHLMHYHNAWSEALCQSAAWCRLMSVVTLACQAGFPLVLLVPATRWVLLPAAVGFHVTTWFAMDTGPYMTLWFLLIAFLPLERVPAWLMARWRAGGLQRLLGLVVCGAPTGLVLFVLSHYFPWWAALVLLPPAWALCLPLIHPRPLEVVVPRGRERWLAWLAAIDWAGRLRLTAGDVAEVRLVDEQGHVRTGPEARRVLRGRLALPLV